ncbi:MAG TPA: LEA type 2 family protein [Gemmatimonadaceae bacterium]|jgi:LEA14-like dessication related protein|nr:LEA type 2 family protein [Gemmatimonadaceae bacterium]
MRKAVLLAVAAVTVAGASGCATLGRKVFKEPVVNFQQLSISGLGLTGGSLDVVLSVYNPNNFRLDASRLTYNLMIDSVRFGSGALDQKFTVQSGDSTIVRLPINFTYAGIGEAGRQLLNTGSVNYRVSGDMTVGTPLGNFTRPYDRTGRYTALRGATR